MQATTNFTPLELFPLPDKSALQDAFVGKPLASLRTPALIVDRTRFRDNCERVVKQAKERGLKFRAHVKSGSVMIGETDGAYSAAHKTSEGTRMMVEAAGGVRALIASTMPEVWQIISSGLVAEGKVDDILYSMPVAASRIEDLNDAQEKCAGKAVIRLMVDHPEQVRALDTFAAGRADRKTKWSVFMKVDGGGRRAGVPPTSSQMEDNIKAVMDSKHVQIYGFYSHFGQSYASSSLDKASDYLSGEVECVNAAAQTARKLGHKSDFVLSVGATPTAHAATLGADINSHLEGVLELHAGCYCMNDCQQMATSLVPPENVALSVLATVVSLYPHRSEAMCDAGALAMSKDTGPWPGFGRVVWPEEAASGWDLGRVSQEHGTLVHRPGATEPASDLRVGQVVRIAPQHACLTCAAYPWFYVVDDGGDTVADVWVPWKGW